MDARRLGAWALACIAALLIVAQVAAIYTESINWDEFALLTRAERTLATGALDGGGRPGLSVLTLLPLVQGCTDEVAVARGARLLWVLFTIGYAAGIFFLVQPLVRRAGCSWSAPALAVAALVLVPVFLRWSVQVRTDQMALAFGVWGGVAILASARRSAWALLGGALLAAGYLSSQKAVYVAALVAVLAAGELWLATGERPPDRPRWIWLQARRFAAAVTGGVLVLLVYQLVTSQWLTPPRVQTYEQGMSVFAWFREVMGFRVYRMMLPSLVPHLAIGALFIAATVQAVRQREAEHLRLLSLAWATLGLGVGVGWFHAAALPYFWMTLGLFPAVAMGLAWPAIAAMLRPLRVAPLVVGSIWVALLMPAAGALLERTDDTQAVQRDSLTFVARHVPKELRGYQMEGALFCRQDPEPIPRMFTQMIAARFYGDKGPANTARYIEEFRERPVAYIVTSYRMGEMPAPVRAFWQRHYLPYRHAVLVSGARVVGAAGDTVSLEILVEGRYRWIPLDAEEALAIRAGEVELAKGDTIQLEPGSGEVEIVRGAGAGVLIFDLDEAPAPGQVSFYSRRQRFEIGGRR